MCYNRRNVTEPKDLRVSIAMSLEGRREFPVANIIEFKVESIVLSVISMLSSPNDESPANIEAAKNLFGQLELRSAAELWFDIDTVSPQWSPFPAALKMALGCVALGHGSLFRSLCGKYALIMSFFPHHVLNWKCFIADGLILSSFLAVYGIIFRWFLSQGLLRNFFVPALLVLASTPIFSSLVPIVLSFGSPRTWDPVASSLANLLGTHFPYKYVCLFVLAITLTYHACSSFVSSAMKRFTLLFGSLELEPVAAYRSTWSSFQSCLKIASCQLSTLLMLGHLLPAGDIGSAQGVANCASKNAGFKSRKRHILAT
ncbi:hypothetical protein CK203_007347 [Vitis vinifera]|uniref:Uncharacterized protein n=1 Tax=Vitis vinifera TaxID=29760 RepID=A0A438G1G4_VITVI|nr:hypothetical protein CK203_007347 [Vitis vinifera]